MLGRSNPSHRAGRASRHRATNQGLVWTNRGNSSILVKTGINGHKTALGTLQIMASPPSSPTLNTVEEVAQALRLQPETVRQMAREGRLPAHKVGKVWRFHPAEIQSWLRTSVEAPSAPSPTS